MTTDELTPGRNLSFIVSTLGRISHLRRLLNSLNGQIQSGDNLIVVAQDHVDSVESLCAEFPDLPLRVVESRRGLSLGRNTGALLLEDTDSVLQFPNDSSYFPDNTISRLRVAVSIPDFRAGCMTVLDEHGPKFILPPPGTPLDRVSVWRALEAGLVVSHSCFEALGGFDTQMGSGAPTPWQSGEGTDFLLRALRRWPVLQNTFLWLPSDISIFGVSEGYGLNIRERRRKIRAYGRGLGWVARSHHYPLNWKLKRLAGGAIIGLRRPSEYKLLDGFWAFGGRLEGMCGKVLGAASSFAVTR
jgi:hypothetical protein